jgi:acyl carrier protein
MLTAFYTASAALDELSLRDYLSARLPAYMIPSRYVMVDEFFYTPNGKLDRKRDYSAGSAGIEDEKDREAYEAPGGVSAVEDEVLKAVRKEIEGGGGAPANVALDSDLTSLGVDSLSLARIIFALEKIFSVEFDLGTLVIGYFTNAGRIAEYVEALLAESGRAETG